MKSFYASVIGKLPRKRKEQRFETRMIGETPLEAIAALKDLIKVNGIRGARCAQMQLWEISETPFIDSEGKSQVLVMRNIFPSGSAIALNLD